MTNLKSINQLIQVPKVMAVDSGVNCWRFPWRLEAFLLNRHINIAVSVTGIAPNVLRTTAIDMAGGITDTIMYMAASSAETRIRKLSV